MREVSVSITVNILPENKEDHVVTLTYSDAPRVMSAHHFRDDHDRDQNSYSLRNKADWPSLYDPPYVGALHGTPTTIGGPKVVAYDPSGGVSRRLVMPVSNTYYMDSVFMVSNPAVLDQFFGAGPKYLQGTTVYVFPDVSGLWKYLSIPDSRGKRHNYPKVNMGKDSLIYAGYENGHYETEIDEGLNTSVTRSLQLHYYLNLSNNRFYIPIGRGPTSLNAEFLPAFHGVPSEHKLTMYRSGVSGTWQVRMVFLVVAQSSGINVVRTDILATVNSNYTSSYPQAFFRDVLTLSPTVPDNCFAYQVEVREDNSLYFGPWNADGQTRANRNPPNPYGDITDPTTGVWAPSIWYEVPLS